MGTVRWRFDGNQPETRSQPLAISKVGAGDDIKFPDRDSCTFGIEEEMFLVNLKNRHLSSDPPHALFLACRKKLGGAVNGEMLRSQLEISSPIFHDHAEATAKMTALRRGVAMVSEEFGFRPMAAGTHPLASWPNQEVTRASRYEEVMTDLQLVARRAMICGLHIHVAIPGDLDRIALMNQLIPWTPAFLALSTSSPFWNCRFSGLCSYRQAVYDEWPNMGTPDFLANEAEFRRLVKLLAKAGAIRDASYLWWTIRPSSKYPTLELRIADSCTALEDSLALASLFRCLVHAYICRPELTTAYSSLSRRIIEANRWAAKRYGLGAQFLDEATGRIESAKDQIQRLLRVVATDASMLDCQEAVERVRYILEHGTSAHRQIQVYQEHTQRGFDNIEALQAVVDDLIETTTPQATHAA
jgi:carboxylate-amine ligase